jgi:hypothetical protein
MNGQFKCTQNLGTIKKCVTGQNIYGTIESASCKIESALLGQSGAGFDAVTANTGFLCGGSNYANCPPRPVRCACDDHIYAKSLTTPEKKTPDDEFSSMQTISIAVDRSGPSASVFWYRFYHNCVGGEHTTVIMCVRSASAFDNEAFRHQKSMVAFTSISRSALCCTGTNMHSLMLPLRRRRQLAFLRISSRTPARHNKYASLDLPTQASSLLVVGRRCWC